MVCSDIVAVCSKIHTKHINTFSNQNVKFLFGKVDGIWSGHWALIFNFKIILKIVLWIYLHVCPNIYIH